VAYLTLGKIWYFPIENKVPHYSIGSPVIFKIKFTKKIEIQFEVKKLKTLKNPCKTEHQHKYQ